jgi:hypothetical protein
MNKEKYPRHGFKIRRKSDGKFLRKSPSGSKLYLGHDEIHYHDNALSAHLYETEELAFAAIGKCFGWFIKSSSPIRNRDEYFDLEVVPATEYPDGFNGCENNDRVVFGEPIEIYWGLNIIIANEINAHKE